MNEQQQSAMNMLDCSVNGQSICSYGTGSTTANMLTTTTYASTSGTPTLYTYWTNQYYPWVIKESYPIYFQEKAMDKGKQAFELLKALMDKGLVKVDKVKDFVEAMDTILKTL